MVTFKDYLEYGWLLTPLRAGTKQPFLKDWSKLGNAIQGTDSVKVCDEKGNDLVGGPLRVAFKEFKILAQYEGL